MQQTLSCVCQVPTKPSTRFTQSLWPLLALLALPSLYPKPGLCFSSLSLSFLSHVSQTFWPSVLLILGFFLGLLSLYPLPSPFSPSFFFSFYSPLPSPLMAQFSQDSFRCRWLYSLLLSTVKHLLLHHSLKRRCPHFYSASMEEITKFLGQEYFIWHYQGSWVQINLPLKGGIKNTGELSTNFLWLKRQCHQKPKLQLVNLRRLEGFTK